MLPNQASFLLSLVTLKSFYLPLSSHSDPMNPDKQEHVYPAAILFFVVSVHVPPFWQGLVKQGPTILPEISKNKDLERNFRKTWNSIKVNKNICMISICYGYFISKLWLDSLNPKKNPHNHLSPPKKKSCQHLRWRRLTS